RQLDGLVDELGHAVVETAATSLRTTQSVLRQLDDELRDGLRLRAGALATSTGESAQQLQRFAFAAGVQRLLVFDADGRLEAEARDLPRASTGVVDSSAFVAVARARLSDINEARRVRIRGHGRTPWLVYVAPLAGGRRAVLFQDESHFARTRAQASPATLAARLESDTSIAFVRFNGAAEALSGDVRTFRRQLNNPAGELVVGLDTRSVTRALAIQRDAARLHAGLAALAVALGIYLVRRHRRSRAELATRLEHEARLAGLGRLAANIAHEVRNPLNAIGIASQRMERRDDLPDDARHLADCVTREVARLDRTVSELLHHARPGPARVGPVDLGTLVGTVVALARAEAVDRGVEIRAAADTSGSVQGDADLLRGALWNLLRNAVGVSPEGGAVSIDVRTAVDEVQLEVSDEGPGLPEGGAGALFEPFHSERTGGSGLGLALALSAAQAHGGTIEAAPRPEGGSTFRLRLPQQGETR
ncbi:MAG: ATP-binding protein, partial [Planctomycetota bacterium]